MNALTRRQPIEQPAPNLAAAFERLSATVSDRLDAMQSDLDQIGNRKLGAVSRFLEVGDQQIASSRVATADELRASLSSAIGNFIQQEGSQAAEEQLMNVAVAGGMTTSDATAGGWLVHPTFSADILQKEFDVSPIARLARRVQIDTGDSFVEPVDPSDLGANWIGEDEDRPETDGPTLKELTVPLNEIYANIPVTQRMLDDSSHNVGAYVEDRISDKFSRTEGSAYMNGDGIKKPLGLLRRPTTLEKDGVRDFFTFQHILSGVENSLGSGAAAAYNNLVDLVYLLRAPYRRNARWMMNSKTIGEVRKLKDANDAPLWTDGIADGQPPSLLGYPVETDEEMPDIATGKSPIAFGDFKQGYIIIDRPGVKFLVDPYTKKGKVLFYAYRRTGGQPQNGEAVKFLKIGPAS